jgi:hypothetical protein
MWPFKNSKPEKPTKVAPVVREYWGSYKYVWRCKCGNVFETLLRPFSLNTIDVCPKCGRDAKTFTKVSARPRVQSSEDSFYPLHLYWEDAPDYSSEDGEK